MPELSSHTDLAVYMEPCTEPSPSTLLAVWPPQKSCSDHYCCCFTGASWNLFFVEGMGEMSMSYCLERAFPCHSKFPEGFLLRVALLGCVYSHTLVSLSRNCRTCGSSGVDIHLPNPTAPSSVRACRPKLCHLKAICIGYSVRLF